MKIRIRTRKGVLMSLAALAAVMTVAAAGSVHAALQDGGGGRDVLFGADDDNAANTDVQPADVTAKQHLDNTDVMLGGSKGDLLIGVAGDDVIDGEGSSDILIGGPEAGLGQPNSDVLLGGNGADVNIWAPGDGSDAFLGGRNHDTQIFAPFILDGDEPALERFKGRYVPRVSIDEKPQFSCTIESAAGKLAGYDYLVRFFANGNLAVTVRLADAEWVLCPSPNPGKVQVAELNSGSTDFVERSLNRFDHTLIGAILGS